MTNENYTVDILVNDKPLRQFPHNGKLFVEAHKGAEYSIRIRNNSWQRILAVCSVDGLDILNGKKADENGNGYVINGNGSLKAEGFRVSDEKVAKFQFDYKGGSYAASKEDGSDRNVGVIGVRLFSEKVKPLPPPPIVVKEEHHHHDHYPTYPYPSRPSRTWWDQPTIWGLGDTIRYGSTVCNSTGDTTCDSGPTADCCDSQPVRFCDMDMGAKRRNNNRYSKPLSSPIRSMKFSAGGLSAQPETKGFNMGTKFGESKESRVIEVEFEKGILALTTNIYYASRESLIEMGVPLGSEKQVSFPEPFNGTKYATPPDGWRG